MERDNRLRMDHLVVKNALGSLERLLSQARQALRDIEREAFGGPVFGDFGGYEYPDQAMAGLLEELHGILLVVLEAANMPEMRSSLANQWSEFVGQGLRHTNNDPGLQSCDSPALTFLERLIEGLRMTVSEATVLFLKLLLDSRHRNGWLFGQLVTDGMPDFLLKRRQDAHSAILHYLYQVVACSYDRHVRGDVSPCARWPYS